jgi:hypothetical protein
MLTVIMLNKDSRTADKEQSSRLEGGRGDKNHFLKEKYIITDVIASDLNGPFCYDSVRCKYL